MKERGVYYSDLDINVVDSTADSHNNPQSFEFFQVFLGQLNCVPHKRSYCLIQNLQQQIADQSEDVNDDACTLEGYTALRVIIKIMNLQRDVLSDFLYKIGLQFMT